MPASTGDVACVRYDPCPVCCEGGLGLLHGLPRDLMCQRCEGTGLIRTIIERFRERALAGAP